MGAGAVRCGPCLCAVPRVSELGLWGAVGTRAHLHWDHVAEQLDFFHGAAGK